MKYTYKVKNGFNVSEFLKLVKIDFVYSTNRTEQEYLLLNESAFGKFKKSDIENQKDKMRIIILNNDTLQMDSYNIPEEELINGLMNMKG